MSAHGAGREKLIKTAAALFWVAVWQLASMALGSDLLLASPVAVAQSLVRMMGESAFWSAVAFSSARIVGGFALAVAVGCLAAVLAAASRVARALIEPLTAVIQSTPVASFIILALLWISSRNLAVFIAFLMVFPVVYRNVLEGIVQVDGKLLQMARVFRVRPGKRMRCIYLPAVLPYFTSACSVGLGLCWKSGIAAEVIGLPTGSIGERLYQAKIYLSTGELFAWTVAIIAVSVAFEKLFLYALRAAGRRIVTGGGARGH
ncbi:ABC transporter permease [Feifania hominis]|uniref:ABC transporter permease subunit n=1 Tax=Feifania hominis TaxID=2763660 RepID=A0A926DF06_9FIRM|nr:ABC transporter permease subunit [Feifania hominis]MBC8536632.1 ABC transporter permease subunit [Feifania hominis]